MSDNVAVLAGYTEEYEAHCTDYDLFLLVKPGTELDDTFTAWDIEAQEFIRVNGWLWSFERVENTEL